jgi:hypothetical protein
VVAQCQSTYVYLSIERERKTEREGERERERKLNENTHQNLWDTAKAVLRETFTALNAYIRQEERLIFSDLIFKHKQIKRGKN